ncbi:amidohydrolase family protein [Aspergillus fumigatus]
MKNQRYFSSITRAIRPILKYNAKADDLCPAVKKRRKRDASLYIALWDCERYMRQAHDLTGVRLQSSNEHGIGCTVISLTVPGTQGIADKTEAETATVTNNWIAEQAGQELHLCVKDLGFDGVVLCFFQHAGPNGEAYLFYDQPYNVKVIIGHLGEHIQFGFCRINHRFQDVNKPIAEYKGKVDRKKTDICIAIGRHFSMVTLKYSADEIGTNRVLFIDYPLRIDLYRCIGQDLAKKLLKLAPVN